VGDPDPLVQEIETTRRGRRRVVILAVLAILLGALLATAITLGAVSRTY